ncbi:hypothetical protein DL96DRAFT_1562338 [Flagelloscypha sp. PMI_526]|nr:hypothetical protein DL96DRAFT_1562338 [Flagelloscypha sp. PMI_526]
MMFSTKLASILTTLLAFTSSSQAASISGRVPALMRFEGCTLTDDFHGTTISATVWDQGTKVCDDGSRIDQDGHLSLTCNPGYIYAVTKNGAHAWVRTPNVVFEMDQTAFLKRDFIDDCYGAGDPGDGGVRFRCTQICWDFMA